MTGPRVLVAPDKFKGTLTAAEAARAIREGVRRAVPDAEIRMLPFADGGEGTVDAALAVGFVRRSSVVAGPLGHPVEAVWALRDGGAMTGVAMTGVAVIEMAAASGLALVPRPTPETALAASTFGTGQLMRAALDAGARRVVLGVGGSATSDGGLGALLALGGEVVGRAEFPGGAEAGSSSDPGARPSARRVDAFDSDPTAALDLSGIDRRLADCELVLCTDVANPFCGPGGAAEVFAPQKGADAAAVAAIDVRLAALALALREATGVDLVALGWGGAGGGIAGGLHAAIGARAADGVDTMAELLGLDAAIAAAELVVVGEGSIDAQSRMGKAPVGIARRAAAAGVPCVAVCGTTEFEPAALAADGILRIAAADRTAQDAGHPASDALAHPAHWVAEAAHHLLESCDFARFSP